MADPEATPPAAFLDSEVLLRLEELESRLSDVQALVARTYESLQEWPRLLTEVRNSPSYEAAYAADPLITVRIATYNAAELLCHRALASLRRQTYENWSALVVGDACSDDTAARIEDLGDSRIRFWNLPFRGPYPDDAKGRWYIAGTAPANEALRAATGAWIAPLDHDDEWDDDHLEVLLYTAQKERAELAYGRIRVVNEETGEQVDMGAWPPERGQFGFLGALYHAGLARFEYDINARFADEPGDWNLARHLWESGVRFSFVDRPVATNYFVKRHDCLRTEARMIEELRGWVRELEEALQYSQSSEEHLRSELERIRQAPSA